MCHLHLCCLDKITARQVFLRLKSSWRQAILLAISISLATVPCLTHALLFLGPWNTCVLLFIRLFWRDAKTKISNLKTHALLLFKSKLILVPGHCWSPRAVVLLPHGVRETQDPDHTRSEPESVSGTQNSFLVTNPVTTTPVPLTDGQCT